MFGDCYCLRSYQFRGVPGVNLICVGNIEVRKTGMEVAIHVSNMEIANTVGSCGKNIISTWDTNNITFFNCEIDAHEDHVWLHGYPLHIGDPSELRSMVMYHPTYTYHGKEGGSAKGYSGYFLRRHRRRLVTYQVSEPVSKTHVTNKSITRSMLGWRLAIKVGYWRSTYVNDLTLLARR